MTFASYPSLAGRAVFITGGASGIGAEFVRAFAGQGSRVAFVDVQRDVAAALVDELSGAAHPPLFLPCDLTDIAALRGAVGQVRERLGAVAVLVNNAGNDDRHRIEDVTPDYWDRVQAINIRPQFFAAQAVIPHMRELGGGSIINLSSIAWRGGGASMAAYASAKAPSSGSPTASPGRSEPTASGSMRSSPEPSSRSGRRRSGSPSPAPSRPSCRARRSRKSCWPTRSPGWPCSSPPTTAA